MRLWSFHPKYLDNIGLSRAINESIAGYKALCKTGEGYPKAWEKHPQLARFKRQYGEFFLSEYIEIVNTERFNRIQDTIRQSCNDILGVNYMTVTKDQLLYEFQLYLTKLKTQKGRYPQYEKLKDLSFNDIKPHPNLEIIDGPIESWEKVK